MEFKTDYKKTTKKAFTIVPVEYFKESEKKDSLTMPFWTISTKYKLRYTNEMSQHIRSLSIREVLFTM
jgi:TfoX/Sxy family transcriptional regulator of competence genes